MLIWMEGADICWFWVMGASYEGTTWEDPESCASGGGIWFSNRLIIICMRFLSSSSFPWTQWPKQLTGVPPGALTLWKISCELYFGGKCFFRSYNGPPVVKENGVKTMHANVVHKTSNVDPNFYWGLRVRRKCKSLNEICFHWWSLSFYDCDLKENFLW